MTIDHYKERLGRQWILVFYHKYESSSDLFVSDEEALDTKQTNKYSILGKIDYHFRIKGKYEFLLEYPKFPEDYNHWTQTKNPIHAQHDTENGYRPIKVSWTDCSWHGLSLSSSTSTTFIDGTPFAGGWFYSIGLKESWFDSIPAFIDLYGLSELDKSKYIVHEVKLWIRINSEQSKCYCHRKITPIVSIIISMLIS